MFNLPIRSRVLLVWLFAAFIGLVVGFVAYGLERAERRRSLAGDAARCAMAFRAEEIDSLTGTRADLGRPAYRAMKARLGKIRAMQPSARVISILRFMPDSGQVIRLVDSLPEGISTVSMPGDVFPEATQIPALQSIFRDFRPAVESFAHDSSGEFVTGYALMASVPQAGVIEARHVVAIDISSREWNRSLWSAVLRSAVLGWLLSGLSLVLFIWFSNRSGRTALLSKLYGAVEQSGSAIMIVNRQGVIDHANAVMCLQTGYTREEFVGRPWREFVSDAALADALAEGVAQLQTGLSWEGLLTNRRKNGETYPARAKVSSVQTPEGKTAGFVAVVTDLSQVERKEREMRTAREEAEAADRAKGRFLATMSHEVRTPLNGIVGFASLLADTPLTPEQLEYVQTIRTSGQALIELTGDILDFSRIESGKLQLDMTPCDLRANLEDAIDIFAGKASEKNVQLLHWVESDVPAQVLIDGGRLRQILINLVGNAIKFTTAGEVEVTLRMLTGKSVSLVPFENIAQGQLMAELDDGGITLEFAVRDTGMGIADEDRSRLFQPFSQLDASTVRRFGGAGLGLAISRNLVRLMGGDIHVESEKGRGSTFIFTIRTRSANTGRTSDGPMYPLAERTVAVAVQAPGLRNELVRLLRQAGAQTVECSFEFLSRGGWDLAVVDCERSVVRALSDGPVAAGWRADAVFGLVPVHLSTIERQDLRRHFRILLNKPVHHRTLLDLLVKSIAVQASKVAGSAAPALDLHVLLADDDVVQQRVLREVLETLGCRCDIVDNGHAALKKLTAGAYDFVLMDLHMPQVDGLTALKQIRMGEAGEAARDVWVAVCTGDARSEIKAMALAAGANDFLGKPIRLADLEAALQRSRAEQKTLARIA